MTTSDDRESILYAFSVEPKHDRPTLDRYLSEHPSLAEDLIDLFSELRLAENYRPLPTESYEDPKAAAAWSEFLSSGSKAEAVNPFKRFQGLAFAELAAKLDVPSSLLLALRDCLVLPASVSSHFARRLAAGLACTVNAVSDHLVRPQETPVGLAFKSYSKPAPQRQVTFRELVMNTKMTNDQRDRLLKECDADGPN